MSDRTRGRCACVLVSLLLIPIPVRSDSHQSESSNVRSKPTKIRYFKVTLHKTIPEGATLPIGSNPHEFVGKPVSSEDVLEAWLRILQGLGFSVNPSKPNT